MTAPAFQSGRGHRVAPILLIHRTNQRAPRISSAAGTAIEIRGRTRKDQYIVEFGPPPPQALEVVGVDVCYITCDRGRVQCD